jgi:hypothetical protein
MRQRRVGQNEGGYGECKKDSTTGSFDSQESPKRLCEPIEQLFGKANRLRVALLMVCHNMPPFRRNAEWNACYGESELSEHTVPIRAGLNKDCPPLCALKKCATTWHREYSTPAAVQSDVSVIRCLQTRHTVQSKRFIKEQVAAAQIDARRMHAERHPG